MTTRDVVVTGAGPRTDQPERRVIAVIGIDKYEHHPKLHNAVSDAVAVRDLFVERGFEALPPLLDEYATYEAIKILIADRLTLGERDSLVLYFAGHGVDEYILPVDAATDSRSRWFDLSTWLWSIARLHACHVLVILDSCDSGIALAEVLEGHRTEAPRPNLPIAQRRSRYVITSASKGQKALDSSGDPKHSLFTHHLLEALRGGMSAADHLVTGHELAAHLRRVVSQSHPSHQTPELGAFGRDEGGAMYLPLAPGVRPPVIAPVPRPVPLRRAPLWGATVGAVAAAIALALPDSTPPPPLWLLAVVSVAGAVVCTFAELGWLGRPRMLVSVSFLVAMASGWLLGNELGRGVVRVSFVADKPITLPIIVGPGPRPAACAAYCSVELSDHDCVRYKLTTKRERIASCWTESRIFFAKLWLASTYTALVLAIAALVGALRVRHRQRLPAS